MANAETIFSQIAQFHRANPFRTSAVLILTTLLLVVAGATAQTYNTPLQHVILVIQENRSTDNLFGSSPSFLPGVDIATQGLNSKGQIIPLTAIPLVECYGLGHRGQDWVAMYDHGKMDGADKVLVYQRKCTKIPENPEFRYVDNSPFPGMLSISRRPLDPYFQIAENWGFANYMFHTNQGPSFASHQFLFSGTSAPDNYGEQYYQYFASEINGAADGCLAPATDKTVLIGPDGKEDTWVYPCFDHPTVANLLDGAGISWKYYANIATGIWTAPITSPDICQPNQDRTQCTGPDWNNDMVIRGVNGASAGQILTDISTNCTLANVSWVIPDGHWSDHAPGDHGWGPAWVANIVNAVGTSSCKNPDGTGYWNTTAILITWDEWGGWYDHVAPPAIGFFGGGGNGQQYVYGFRVPLLAVSAYSPHPGYVSGPVSNPLVCPNYYCHDFGSILNFIEYVFGSNGKSLGTIGNPNWPYADYFALDAQPSCPTCTYSLADFFNFKQSPTKFVEIPAPLPPSFFINFKGHYRQPDDDDDPPSR
jgi:phospholipase C